LINRIHIINRIQTINLTHIITETDQISLHNGGAHASAALLLRKFVKNNNDMRQKCIILIAVWFAEIHRIIVLRVKEKLNGYYVYPDNLADNGRTAGCQSA